METDYIGICREFANAFFQIAQKLTDRAVSIFGRLDGMVICHGALTPVRLGDDTMDNFKHVFDVNVFSNLAVVSPTLVAHAVDRADSSRPKQG